MGVTIFGRAFGFFKVGFNCLPMKAEVSGFAFFDNFHAFVDCGCSERFGIG